MDRFSIKLHKQIFIGTDYRLHSAYYDGNVVAVKMFEGRNAAQVWWLVSICPRCRSNIAQNCRTTAEREVKVMCVRVSTFELLETQLGTLSANL